MARELFFKQRQALSQRKTKNPLSGHCIYTAREKGDQQHKSYLCRSVLTEFG